MKRQQLINLIRVAAAQDDSATITRLYCENRISYEALKVAVAEGRKWGEFCKQRDGGAT